MRVICFILAVLAAFGVFCINCSALGDSAGSAIVINADIGEILFEKNAEVCRSMASTTKIMTGLLLAESNRLDEIITCTAEAVTVEGSAMGLKAGDKISARDLLYGLMLQSGNDAANVAAFFLAGDISSFADMMNKKAKQIGMKNTNFVTPSGLDDDEHYTTAYDMALLTAYALENEEFLKVVSSYTASVAYGNPMQTYTIKNHNRLLHEFDGCIGVKTGYTKKSGRCLVTAAERDGKRVIAVTLKDLNDWKDHTEMLEYGLGCLESLTFTSNDKELSTRLLCGEETAVSLDFEDITVSCTEESRADIELELIIPSAVMAPIEEGQIIGRAAVYYKGKEIKSIGIFAKKSIASIAEDDKESFASKLINYIFLMLKTV